MKKILCLMLLVGFIVCNTFAVSVMASSLLSDTNDHNNYNRRSGPSSLLDNNNNHNNYNNRSGTSSLLDNNNNHNNYNNRSDSSIFLNNNDEHDSSQDVWSKPHGSNRGKSY